MREAATLQLLAELGVAAPNWIAAGESSDGGAFLLLESVEGAMDLRTFLARECVDSPAIRRRLARRLGQAIAAIHGRGIQYPDLCAKHVLIKPKTLEFTFLDWQRSSWPRRLSWRQRCRDLAALNASLADHLANAELRFQFLLAYWKALGNRSAPKTRFCARIQARTRRLLRRSSVREQRLPLVRESQPLTWLQGEEICVTPAGGKLIDVEDWQAIAYPARQAGAEFVRESHVVLGGQTCVLTIRRSVRRLRHTLDVIRGRRWTSPECRRAAQLLRDERIGKPATLLAFGQRRAGWGVVDSFLLTQSALGAGERA
jgi:tRNA A-37 threonylcarbamoyl transferase component Bud32